MVAHFVPYVSPEHGKLHTRAEFMYSVPLPGFKFGRAQLAEPWLKDGVITKDSQFLEDLQRVAELETTPGGGGGGDGATTADVPTLPSDFPRTTVRKIIDLSTSGQWNEQSRKDLFEDRTLVNYKHPFY